MDVAKLRQKNMTVIIILLIKISIIKQIINLLLCYTFLNVSLVLSNILTYAGVKAVKKAWALEAKDETCNLYKKRINVKLMSHIHPLLDGILLAKLISLRYNKCVYIFSIHSHPKNIVESKHISFPGFAWPSINSWILQIFNLRLAASKGSRGFKLKGFNFQPFNSILYLIGPLHHVCKCP